MVWQTTRKMVNKNDTAVPETGSSSNPLAMSIATSAISRLETGPARAVSAIPALRLRILVK